MAKDRKTSLESKIKAVEDWLEDNQIKLTPLHRIKFLNFRFHDSGGDLKGECLVRLWIVESGQSVHEFQANIGWEITGKPYFTWPMFTSPLGVPCSYEVFVGGDRELYSREFQRLVPSIRPFGYQKDINDVICSGDPFSKRIYDEEKFAARLNWLQANSSE